MVTSGPGDRPQDGDPGDTPPRPDVILGELQDNYEHISFSGGGLRCFWQGGALDALRERRTLAPRSIAASSGGALSACCFVANRGAALIDAFGKRLARHDSNVRFSGSLHPRELTPHQQMYRDVVADVLDEEACQAVADGPELEILLAALPSWLPRRAGAAVTMLLYEVDKRLRSTPHGTFAQSIGAKALRIDARDAARKGRLVDLVCTAATIPPVFRIKTWEGQAVIDAGTLENAPMPETSPGRTLTLLTRNYRDLPQVEGRTYLYPSEATPADKIDFTDAKAIRRTYEQGLSDVRALLRWRDRQDGR